MTTLVKIPLENATNKQLLTYATSVLNLDVAPGANSSNLRAKINQANPDLTEIEVPEDQAGAAGMVAAPTPAPAKPSAIPDGRPGQHFSYDPKVRLMVQTSSDPARSRDVQLSVNNDTVIIKRGVQVDLSYRFYLALDAAVEKVARDTDEINPTTGLPFKEWVTQHSYPFQVFAMPSAEEIEAWTVRTADINKA